MADKKISALTAATTPLVGTEVLPIVQSGATVKVANNDLRPKQIQSNVTTGVLQVAGPAAAATRVMTTPDANFTAARTDAAQTFTGDQTFNANVLAGTTTNTNSARIISNGLFQTTSMLATSGHSRFQGTDATVTGATGVGMELYVSSSISRIQSFNRTSPGFSPLELNCSTLSSGSVYNNTVGATNRAVFVDNGGLIGYLASVRSSKKNISPIVDVSWLADLEPVTFNYRKKDADGKYTEETYAEKEYGLVAEQVEAVNKELCFYDETENGFELRGISYSKLIVPLLAKIQELETRLKKLEL